MFLDATILQSMLWVGAVGAAAGLIGGFIASADSLFGTLLVGIIGGITASVIVRIAGGPTIYTVGDGFDLVWAAAGGLIFGFVVGRSNV
ncbi:MAG: hypothetical protein DIU67_010205 [Actinomycetes bacterium]|jgi:uncharacterized membrane protein YeaQ/YmgE (transglycosylase-associated protein family)|nr:MAG: hypothetical protein DIU67_00310 [Actinomycetota bacterium]